MRKDVSISTPCANWTTPPPPPNALERDQGGGGGGVVQLAQGVEIETSFRMSFGQTAHIARLVARQAKGQQVLGRPGQQGLGVDHAQARFQPAPDRCGRRDRDLLLDDHLGQAMQPARAQSPLEGRRRLDQRLQNRIELGQAFARRDQGFGSRRDIGWGAHVVRLAGMAISPAPSARS